MPKYTIIKGSLTLKKDGETKVVGDEVTLKAEDAAPLIAAGFLAHEPVSTKKATSKSEPSYADLAAAPVSKPEDVPSTTADTDKKDLAE